MRKKDEAGEDIDEGAEDDLDDKQAEAEALDAGKPRPSDPPFPQVGQMLVLLCASQCVRSVQTRWMGSSRRTTSVSICTR